MKGDQAEYQNADHCWTRGTVQYVEWPEMKIEGPGGVMVEKRPAMIHLLVFDSLTRSYRIRVLPAKRVRAVNA